MERTTQASGKGRRWCERPRALGPDNCALTHDWTRATEQLSKAQTITVAAIERGVAALAQARDILAEFQAIIRRKALCELDAWLNRAAGSLIAAFANGIIKDRDAVQAAISSAWSNGQTEGQICKLKLVKRQMYGRGNIDLLQARVIGIT